MSKLATKQDLNKIIEDAVKRIGKDQSNIKDTKGVTITNEDIKDERKEMIEDALGLKIYQYKREESKRKRSKETKPSEFLPR